MKSKVTCPGVKYGENRNPPHETEEDNFHKNQTYCKDCKRDLNKYYNPKNNPKNNPKRDLTKYAHNGAKRRATKLKATPKWLKDYHEDDIKKIYEYRTELNKIAGYVMFHVDHIVPLQGNNVCGLHVPWNLRVITAEENLQKGNSHETRI